MQSATTAARALAALRRAPDTTRVVLASVFSLSMRLPVFSPLPRRFL